MKARALPMVRRPARTPHRGEAPAVTMAIAKKAGTNAVVVADAVLKKLDQLKRQAIPADISVAVTRNDGAKANDAVNTLVEHLGIAIGSVVVILVFFLGWREAGIVTLTVPLILFVVLTIGLIAGQTINRITLFALILSLGLLVDAAIVVVENIHRHLHHGIGDQGFQGRGDPGHQRNRQPDQYRHHRGDPGLHSHGLRHRHDGPLHAAHPVQRAGGDDRLAADRLHRGALGHQPVAAEEGRAKRTRPQRKVWKKPARRKTDPLHRAYVKVVTPFIEHRGRAT